MPTEVRFNAKGSVFKISKVALSPIGLVGITGTKKKTCEELGDYRDVP